MANRVLVSSFLANLFAQQAVPLTMTCSCSSASFSYLQLPLLVLAWDFEQHQLRAFL